MSLCGRKRPSGRQSSSAPVSSSCHPPKKRWFILHRVVVMAPDEDKLSLEVKEDAATLMVCVRLLLENPETSAMRRAYTLLCKVNSPVGSTGTVSILLMFPPPSLSSRVPVN